eukprot:2650962-Prymnesium_polylepis.2
MPPAPTVHTRRRTAPHPVPVSPLATRPRLAPNHTHERRICRNPPTRFAARACHSQTAPCAPRRAPRAP